MFNHLVRISEAMLEYVRALVGRTRVASIAEWPMYREW
jgi:hypothetical protein